MAGRGCQKGISVCEVCRRYLNKMDGKLKCFFSDMNSNFGHGMTIIHIPDSRCGKNLSCAGTKTTSDHQEGNAYSVDTLSGSQDNATQSSASEGPAGYQLRSSSRRVKTAKKAASSLTSKKSGEDSPTEHNQSPQTDHEKTLSDLCFFSCRCDLTPEQEVELAELVGNIQPEFPLLVAQMKKSNVKSQGASLVISKGYAMEHFPAESETITLERSGGKKWHVRLHIRPEGRGYLLTGHWADFVQENRVKENDICVFQPIKGNGSFRVMVHLLNKARSRSQRGTRKLTSTAQVHVKTEHSHKSPSSNHHGRKEPYVSLDTGTGGPSQPPSYVVLGSTKLTPAQEKIVVGKVQAIGSQFPIFVASVTKKIAGDNGSYSLDFDTQYAAPHLPDGKQTLMLHQAEWSKAWCVRLRNRQMVPGELRGFANDNRLWTGDLCLFEPMKVEKVAMMVHIIRSEHCC